jgi:hypothetical protein
MLWLEEPKRAGEHLIKNVTGVACLYDFCDRAQPGATTVAILDKGAYIQLRFTPAVVDKVIQFSLNRKHYFRAKGVSCSIQ